MIGRHAQNSPRRRANALMMAVVLVAILAIMGSTFVMMARVDRETVRGIAVGNFDQTALELVLNQIETVLGEDVIGKPETTTPSLNNDGDTSSGETQLNLLAEPTTSETNDPTKSSRYDATRIQRPDFSNLNILNEAWDYPSHGHTGLYDDTAFFTNVGQPRLPPFLGLPKNRWVADDKWLASTEPEFDASGKPYWGHITDIDGQIAEMAYIPNDDRNPNESDAQEDITRRRLDLDFKPVTGADPSASNKFAGGVPAYLVHPDPPANMTYPGGAPNALYVPDKFKYVGDPADADGDGVTDSRWIKVRVGFTQPVTATAVNYEPVYLQSPEGHDVYVAIRIIDNCSMVNLNTSLGGRDTTLGEIDGSRLTDIDQEGFATYPDNTKPEHRLFRLRAGLTGNPNTTDLETFNKFLLRLTDIPGKLGAAEVVKLTQDGVDPDVVRKYRLFDFGEEMELRYRCFLNSPYAARVEGEDAWKQTFNRYGPLGSLDLRRTRPFDPRGDAGQGDLLSGGGSTDPEGRVWAYYLDPAQVTPPPLNNDYPGVLAHYDRRHLCTFYSWDRTLRRRYAPLDQAETDKPGYTNTFLDPDPGRDMGNNASQDILIPRYPNPLDLRQVAHELTLVGSGTGSTGGTALAAEAVVRTLYTLRSYFLDAGYTIEEAALRSAQVVANLIDRTDSDNAAGPHPLFTGLTTHEQYREEPTVIEADTIESLIRVHLPEVWPHLSSVPSNFPSNFLWPFGLTTKIAGYERQPFIVKVGVRMLDNDSGASAPAATEDEPEDSLIELYNPYLDVIDLSNWQITNNGNTFTFPLNFKMPAGSASDPNQGRILLVSGDPSTFATYLPDVDVSKMTNMSHTIGSGPIELKRPILGKTDYLVVDRVTGGDVGELIEDYDVGSPDEKPGTYYDRILRRNDAADTMWGFARATMLPEGIEDHEGTPDTAGVWRYQLEYARTEVVNICKQEPTAGPTGGGIGELFGYLTEEKVETLADFLELLVIGHHPETSKPITEFINEACIADGTSSGIAQTLTRIDPVPFEVRTNGVNNPRRRQDNEISYVSILDYVTFMMKPEDIYRGLNTVPASLANPYPPLYSDLRLHGRVNINTAPREVLIRVFQPFATYFDKTKTSEADKRNLAADIADAIIESRKETIPTTDAVGSPQRNGHVGFASVQQLLDLNIFRKQPSTLTYPLPEQYEGFGKVYSLLTTRTDVVTAYVLMRVQQSSGDPDDLRNDTLISQRRYVAVFDRSGVFASFANPAYDGIDNDGDGKIDQDDNATPLEDYEHDGLDNDGDGDTDEAGETSKNQGVRLIGMYQVPDA